MPQPQTRDGADPAAESYTRAQSIQNGTLIDAGKLAREAGFTRPVALTSSAWKCCVRWTPDDSIRQVDQDEHARLWDVLYMACDAARIDGGSREHLLFPLYRVPRDGHSCSAKEVTLKLAVGPGDDGGSVVTIMLPNED